MQVREWAFFAQRVITEVVLSIMSHPSCVDTPTIRFLLEIPTDAGFIVFQAIAPLLENNHPPPDLCEFFCKVWHGRSGLRLQDQPASLCARWELAWHSLLKTQGPALDTAVRQVRYPVLRIAAPSRSHR